MKITLRENIRIFSINKCISKQEMSNDTYPPDHDLGPSDPKINRGHLLVMTNLHVKYEDSVINGI